MSQHLLSPLPRLLVVEDDDLLRETLCSLLRRENYVVDEAATGSAALNLLSLYDYNTVILDLVLPEPHIQGTEVLWWIKADFPNLPVIAFSGRARNDVVLKTIELGVDSFLLKYLTDYDILLDIVRKCVHKDKLTNNISKYLQDEGEYFVIRGISSDMHIYVMQFAMFFEVYLWRFKGIRARVSILSDGNNVKVKFESDAPQERIFQLFSQYLSLAEHAVPTDTLFEIPVSQNDRRVLTQQLANQLSNFTTSISQAFYLFKTEEKSAAPSRENAEYSLNISKVIRGLQVRPRDYEYERLSKEANAASARAAGLMMKNDIIPAGNELLAFCQKYGMDEIGTQITSLLNRYHRAANAHLRGFSTPAEYDKELNNILNVFIFEVIPAVERYPKTRRA